MARVRFKDTKPEFAALHALGYRHGLHRAGLPRPALPEPPQGHLCSRRTATIIGHYISNLAQVVTSEAAQRLSGTQGQKMPIRKPLSWITFLGNFCVPALRDLLRNRSGRDDNLRVLWEYKNATLIQCAPITFKL